MSTIQGDLNWLDSFEPREGVTTYAVGDTNTWNTITTINKSKFNGGLVDLDNVASLLNNSAEFHVICNINASEYAIRTFKDLVDNPLFITHFFKISGTRKMFDSMADIDKTLWRRIK